VMRAGGLANGWLASAADKVMVIASTASPSIFGIMVFMTSFTFRRRVRQGPHRLIAKATENDFWSGLSFP